MKKDNTIVKRMFRYLTMSVLKENLAEIWQKYKDMYDDNYTFKVLGHVNFYLICNLKSIFREMKIQQMKILKI